MAGDHSNDYTASIFQTGPVKENVCRAINTLLHNTKYSQHPKETDA
jgi:hypothetical protein